MEEIKTQKAREGKRTFNVLDIIILLLAAFFVAVLVMFFFPRTADALAGGRTYDITYTVVFSGIDYDVAEDIVDNLQVVDKRSGAVIGTVTGVPTSETHYSLELRYDDAGTPVFERVEYSDKIDLIVDITAKASYSEGNGYMVNGSRIACGREYGLRISSAFDGNAVCTLITVNSD